MQRLDLVPVLDDPTVLEAEDVEGRRLHASLARRRQHRDEVPLADEEDDLPVLERRMLLLRDQSEPAVTVLIGRAVFDERVREGLADEELSVGDFVLTGGELPAMLVMDAVSRFIPGVLGRKDAVNEDSFAHGHLDSPYYTRPPVHRGRAVPEVLLSGDHKAISQWREDQAKEATRRKRPDLLR